MNKKLLSLFLFLLPLFAFGGVVSGTVRDSLGQPVPYTIVGVKNSTYGVNTNLNGAYFLELKAGNYTLVFQQLGYVKQEHDITISDERPLVFNVILKATPSYFQTFEVKAKGDRDKVKEIMKHVIDARNDYWNRVNNYKCNTYQKSSLEKVLIEKPGDTLVPRAKPVADTASGKKKGKNLEEEIKNQQLNLIESVSETYFRAPNAFKENILAYHDFAEKKQNSGHQVSEQVEYGEHEIVPTQVSDVNPYLLLSDAQSMDFNFYRNEINAPAICQRPLLSPAAATAFLSYRFEYLESFQENGKTIHKINVIPLFPQDALFSGTLFIQDSTWAIVSVNLNINKSVLYFCKEFSVIQDYEEVAPQIFLPVRREFFYTIHEGQYNIIGNTRVDHSEYEVNGTIPPKTFTDEVTHYDDAAFDRDSSYWVEHRTIKLEEKEIKYVHTVDSLVAYYASPEYLSHEDSAFNHINVWSFLLNGVGHRNRVKGTEIFFDPLIADCVPFGVGGYRQKIGGHYYKDFTNGYYLETDGQVDYGFLNRDVRGKVGVGLTYVPLHFVRTFVRFGDYYDMINNYASLESVFARSNYVRTKQFSVAQRMEIVNGLFAELTFEYSDQNPITGMHLEQWSQYIFGPLNAPVAFERYTKSEVRLEFRYRFRQKYMIKDHKKIILGSKFPEIKFLYRKGIPGLLGSEVDFDYIEVGSSDDIKLGRFGTSSFSVLAGSFVNKKDLRQLEHKYFRGSDSYIFSDPMKSFQLLPTTFETADAYFRFNFIHHFEGCFGTKIPFYSKLKIQMAVGGGVLMIPSQHFYHEEFFAGVERVVRIRKQLFRVGIFAATADNTLQNPVLTWKVGLSYYDTMTKKWSY